jgi:ribosome biogenesis GTPase
MARRLTDRQKERIQKIQERRRQRLEERAEATLEESDDQPLEGCIIARHGANLAVSDSDDRIHLCLSRQNLGHPVCGDRVVWHATENGHGVITALLPRTTELSRPDYSGREKPLAANITHLVIVLAPEPEPSEYLIDQYLVAAEKIGVKVLIALNKIDLLDEKQASIMSRRLTVYEKIGYRVVAISAKQIDGLTPLIEQLQGETNILVGQSGVGKSSLIKALLPSLEIQIGRLSEATGLGRHTTSATTCYKLPEGGDLIDSPGVRSFRLGAIDPKQLEWGFREFRPYLGHCKFSDCSHLVEPGCALKQAVTDGKINQQRFDNCLHIRKNLPE